MDAPRTLLTAEQLMQRDVLTLGPDQDVVDAVQTLLRSGVSGAPVVEDGRVVGMFSERDSLTVLAAAAYDAEPRGRVAHHMRSDIRCVAPNTDLFQLTQLFQESLVRRLPVVDENRRLLGLVMRGDVMRGLQSTYCERRQVPKVAPRTPYERVAEQLSDG